MSLVYDQQGNPRYFGIYLGFVVDNRDPEKLGRVTVRVPGLIAASGWAWPLGSGGGSKKNGAWDVPKKDATVAVMFHQGDVDHPVFLHGWYGRGMPPEPAASASKEDAPDKIKCFESDRHLVVLDGRGGKEQVLIKDKKSGNMIMMKDGTIHLGPGSEQPLPMMGVVNGDAVDPFTGMKHWMLGNASKVVFAKK